MSRPARDRSRAAYGQALQTADSARRTGASTFVAAPLQITRYCAHAGVSRGLWQSCRGEVRHHDRGGMSALVVILCGRVAGFHLTGRAHWSWAADRSGRVVIRHGFSLWLLAPAPGARVVSSLVRRGWPQPV